MVATTSKIERLLEKPIISKADWKKADWPTLLVAEFEARGELTMHDVIRVCGEMFCADPWGIVRQQGFVVEPTGRKDRSRSHNPRYFRMVSKPSWLDEKVTI
jgi:hypothetical protein